ncbi:cobaltochelatase subunit CobN [Beijerinckia indica]|uniref:Cobaltochelatase, CobN subunit n=1 Tax=Beijerinckia indica subsp. indica (strain ATCC 9039 / DSM 1715 / NCIMB 8712) TaxID=395963 RepID=B2IFG4_BEII9|nr:cobaltochelatase subunit CobN [Beijerinckia indica]ACB97064.1 cobaltochelatase, CobN subunit [Beijerinckia indica subsp. indica ATCC 9039]
MHLLRVESHSLDASEAAVDLGQTPADLVFLSFSDSDLALMSRAAEGLGTQEHGARSLRLANLAQLKHPYSIDLYLENVIAKARFVLVRLLGGLDYWRYGVEELSAATRRHDFELAIVPGDERADPRLAEASTLAPADLDRLWAYCQYGGLANQQALLGFIENRFFQASMPSAAPVPVPSAGRFEKACFSIPEAKGHVLILFYRSFLLCGDTAAIEALGQALADRYLSVTTLFVASLKDEDAKQTIAHVFSEQTFDVVINTTGFSARLDAGTSILDGADAPVLQAWLGTMSETQWDDDPRGVSAADLAMNVVLPEMDGRLITRMIAAKMPQAYRADLEFTPSLHAPLPSRIAYVADLAKAWAALRHTQPKERRLACIVSDYPGKSGQAGHAVGLDTGQSLATIAGLLKDNGYTIDHVPEAGALLRRLAAGQTQMQVDLAFYRKAFAALPKSFCARVEAQWGAPEADPAFQNGAFSFPILRCGHLLMAVQPDRGAGLDRKATYHDAGQSPRHAYIAFYLWFQHTEQLHALIHCGTHGTLEWLPGKAAALTPDCAPEILTGSLPVIYPFIVNNPGEASQAKRRINALVLGHMTPPLTAAGSHGIALELEALLDEYAAAEWLDPKRAKKLAQTILRRAQETGFVDPFDLTGHEEPSAALQKLDASLCDMKEMRIGDGLHVFAQGRLTREDMDATLAAQCNAAEARHLLAALDGRFVPPGPGGAPSRGRLDVLPTGRNLYGIDPRTVPTPTAWEIGQLAAEAVVERYVQDHGDWPRAIVMDLWASATMRTGGNDFAQALALIGAKPIWDFATARVTGFEILPEAKLARPRVDVTLRISGLFRDVFPTQITLFDQAITALAGLDEDPNFNPFVGKGNSGPLARIFGAAPGAYGLGLTRALAADPTLARAELGALYLASTSHAYGGIDAQGTDDAGFEMRVAAADAFLHVQDQAEQDCLDSDAVIDHSGGFAAAAKMLGKTPALYHIETTRPDSPKIRTLHEDLARIVQGRLTNPRWLSGQMRHGYRGAAEIARAADHLFAMAVLSDAVPPQAFSRLFEALCADPAVRAFLVKENPEAARALAECFEAARARGFWQSRRNSDAACLADLRA